jgi:hypothetical protein
VRLHTVAQRLIPQIGNGRRVLGRKVATPANVAKLFCETNGLETVCLPEHLASAQVLRKAGIKLEGVLHSYQV